MLNVIILFWSKRTPLEKLFVIVITALLLYSSYTTIRGDYFANKYYSQSEKQYNQINEKLKAISDIKIEITKDLKEVTKKTKVRTTKINDKLKLDEENIDNNNISINELRLFLADYEQNN